MATIGTSMDCAVTRRRCSSYGRSATRFIDQGLARLQQVLAQHAVPTFTASDEDDDVRRLDDLCDTVVSALLPDHGRTNDDAALLIVHTRAIHAGDVASWILPKNPRAAKQAREHFRNQLAAWELDELAITTELLASELVGNVIRHAKGPIRLRLLRSRSLTCEVYDGSLSTPASATPPTPTRAAAACNSSPPSPNAGAPATSTTTANASGPNKTSRTAPHDGTRTQSPGRKRSPRRKPSVTTVRRATSSAPRARTARWWPSAFEARQKEYGPKRPQATTTASVSRTTLTVITWNWCFPNCCSTTSPKVGRARSSAGTSAAHRSSSCTGGLPSVAGRSFAEVEQCPKRPRAESCTGRSDSSKR